MTWAIFWLIIAGGCWIGWMISLGRIFEIKSINRKLIEQLEDQKKDLLICKFELAKHNDKSLVNGKTSKVL
jgi:hypothetical protein